MLKNKVFYKNDVSDKILMVLPRASDKVLNNLKGLPLCELITFETTPFICLITCYQYSMYIAGRTPLATVIEDVSEAFTEPYIPTMQA
jgi:hypothetical protein